jgi:hypothetical protein
LAVTEIWCVGKEADALVAEITEGLDGAFVGAVGNAQLTARLAG